MSAHTGIQRHHVRRYANTEAKKKKIRPPYVPSVLEDT